MKNRIFCRRSLLAVVLSALLLTMSGCRNSKPDDSIHVYSNGTSAVIAGEQEVYSAPGNAEFYVPEGMETDYYRLTALTAAEMEV